ncbi:tRNA (adenosine(37)-N6)-threonylcarbamoyltransferase complex dimerization subunit type 1 TsaB [Pseudomonadota bacterium]
MKLLAVETATEACSVALWLDGQVRETCNQQPHGHARTLLPMIQSILDQAGVNLSELNAIAYGKGPGSFTGLRVGLGVVQGLALARKLPVISVSSLASLAQGQAGKNILAALDARMGQVYWGAYQRRQNDRVELTGQEQVNLPTEIQAPGDVPWKGAGSGWDVYPDTLSQRIGERLISWEPQQFPRAIHTATLAVAEYNLGRAVAAEYSSPEYIRNQVATQPKK